MKKSLIIYMFIFFMLLLVNLVSCSTNENRVVIYTAAEEERIQFLQQELKNKFPEYEVVFQSLGTGNLVSKLQAEGLDTECDIFYDLEVTNAEIILNSNENIFYDLSIDYDFSIYDESVLGYTKEHFKYAINGKTDGAIIVNKEELEKNGCSIPQTYDDLLKEEYKDLIKIPNPKSSGTGYAFYNGLVSSIGEENALEYFEKLDKNIKEYTTSGSAPIKSVDKGEVAIGFGLLWQCVEYANKNENLEVVFLNNEASYNLFTMGIIAGKEQKVAIKEVFNYLFNELNSKQCAKFNPDKIYVDQAKAEIFNYPTLFTEIDMKGIFDYKYKQDLLDKWRH